MGLPASDLDDSAHHRVPRARSPAIKDKPCVDMTHDFKWHPTGSAWNDICDNCGWSRAEVGAVER